jgi:hypothetical protein
VHNLLWGGSDSDSDSSSLLAHVALVRNAHQYGHHNRRTVSGRWVRDSRPHCDGCVRTPLSGDRLRALVDTYASRMSRSVAATQNRSPASLSGLSLAS